MKFLLAACVMSATVFAQALPERIAFQNILANKDVALGEVDSIYQDREGFMWFGGGNALIRYDGYEFREIKLKRQNSRGATEEVSVKFALNFMEDSKGILWIPTREGLFYYDARSDVLSMVPDDPTSSIRLSNAAITKAIETAEGGMVLSTYTGLIKLDPVKKTYSAFDPQGLPKGIRVNGLEKGDAGVLWLGTVSGLARLDLKSSTATLIKTFPQDAKDDRANTVIDLAADKQGNLWIGTSRGLVRFDPKTQGMQRFEKDPTNPKALLGDDIWRVFVDANNVPWVATDGGGVAAYVAAEGRFYNYTLVEGRDGSLSSKVARTVFEDKSGDVWVGNYPNGINYFDRSSAAIVSYAHEGPNPNSLSNDSVAAVKEDKFGNLWIGTDGGGLNYFDREKGTFTSYQNRPKDPTSLSANAVLGILIDSKGTVWTGTWSGGLSSIDPTTRKITNYPISTKVPVPGKSVSDSLNSPTVWGIREDKNGMLWLGTHTGGLNKYDPKTKQFTHYVPDPNNPDSLTNIIVWSTFEDSKGNFWVLTSNGLDLFDEKTEKFTHFKNNPADPASLSNDWMLSMLEDSKGRLWFGTNSGLNLFNRERKTFTSFLKKDGLNNDGIRAILEDEFGKLWLQTNNGISVLDPETKKFKNISRIGGRLVGGFHTQSGTVSSKKEIILGGYTGLRIIKPKDIAKNETKPPVALTEFRIFADKVEVGGPDGLLKDAINHTKSITLDYTKSMFVFGFTALNFRDTEKNSYAYKLEGFDKDWIEAGSQRQAKYTNLNASTYVFRVKGANNDGVWNEEGKSITIVQMPPPWLTWWAYSIYALLVLGAIGWFIQSQRNKRKAIEEQNRILELRVAERTAELRVKNNDIQAMLGNMPQGLFTIVEGGKIHPEYSRYLESIFGTTEVAGQDVAKLLFDGAKIGADAMDSVKAAMFSIIGEDSMNFDFNSALLVTEYQLERNDFTKWLALDWSPIIDNDVVNKLMVSVRDVTQLRQMEGEAKEQKQQIDMISQLLNLSSDKYGSFEKSAQRYLKASKDLLSEGASSSGSDEVELIATLFRHMHTIKGNSRILGFTHLSNAAHDAETIFSKLRESGEALDRAALSEQLVTVEKSLDQYANVYREVLGRGKESKDSRQDGIWMNFSGLDKIQSMAEAAEFKGIKHYISVLRAKSLEKILGDIVRSLDAMAVQLEKSVPRVAFTSDAILIENNSFELLTDVFSHIMRNSLDHGIEGATDRVASGKDESGVISIRTFVDKEKLCISIQDDGRGLNMAALKNKGVQLGKWSQADAPAEQDIANIIFESGVTTKAEVSDISGRGVGMDAVQKMLREAKGEARLVLHKDKPSAEGFIAFELIVELPSSAYVQAQS